MSEWLGVGGLDPWRSIRRFPPVEGLSDEGIEGERMVTHSHLLTAVWSSSLNHKQVSLQLFFHPSRSSSPPSASLWGSEAWETGSKHRSYDSAWARLWGAGGGDTVREQQLEFSLSIQSNTLFSHTFYQLFSICKCINLIIRSLFGQLSKSLQQTSHHLLPCCCFRAWHGAFHVSAGLCNAIMAPLACDPYHKSSVAWDEPATFSYNCCCSCCFCHCCYYEKHRSTISFISTPRPFLSMHAFFPQLIKKCFVGSSNLRRVNGYFTSERPIEPKRARVYFSQDNYCFSGTALKQTCISHS